MTESKKSAEPFIARTRIPSVGFTANMRCRQPFRVSRPRVKTSSIGLLGLMILSLLFGGLFVLQPNEEQSSKASSGSGPLVVWGYVNDTLNMPVVGSQVNVSLWSGSTPLSYLLTSSDESGFYTVTFAREAWTEGNTIEVVAKYGTLTATNSTTAQEPGEHQIDVEFSEEIPEFGFIPGVVISACVTIILLRRRS